MNQIVVVARAISHPVRLAMYLALGQRGQSLTEVARSFGLSVAGAHHHLDVLRRAQMIRKRYAGRRAIYFWSRFRWSLVRERAPERGVETARLPEDQPEPVVDGDV